MKVIRRISENPVMLAFMVSLILFVSCAKDEVRNANIDGLEINYRNGGLTGEDLFKSIIFADGPITHELEQLEIMSSQINQFNAEDLEQYRSTQYNIIQYLNNQDPYF